MKVCKNCEQSKPDAAFFEDGHWCHACVLQVLDEQAHETMKVRPQVFRV